MRANQPTPEEIARVLMPDKSFAEFQSAFADLSDAEFDQVLDRLYAPQDWPAGDSADTDDREY